MSGTKMQIGEGLKKELASLLDKFPDLNSIRVIEDGGIVLVTEPLVLESIDGGYCARERPKLGRFAIAIHEDSAFPAIMNLDNEYKRKDSDGKTWDHPHVCEGIPQGEEFVTAFGQAQYYGNWEHMLIVCLEFLRTAKVKQARAWM